jgi:NAD-dependent dihydropyrimidine dehydrogenase PreA subunit
MPPVISARKCVKCGFCTDVCPVDVFYGSEKKRIPVVALPDDCYFCGACILECSANAITLKYPLYSQPSYLSDQVASSKKGSVNSGML